MGPKLPANWHYNYNYTGNDTETIRPGSSQVGRQNISKRQNQNDKLKKQGT